MVKKEEEEERKETVENVPTENGVVVIQPQQPQSLPLPPQSPQLSLRRRSSQYTSHGGWRTNKSSSRWNFTTKRNNDNDEQQAHKSTIQNRYSDYPLLCDMMIHERIRTVAFELDGQKQIFYPKSNENWLRTILIIEGRALDKFVLPWCIVMFNAIVYTVLVESYFTTINTTNNDDKDDGTITTTKDFSSYETYFALVLNSSLAFLLVFRLNRSAERFWQARASWGMILALSRAMVGGVLVHGRRKEKRRKIRRRRRSDENDDDENDDGTRQQQQQQQQPQPNITITYHSSINHQEEVMRWIAAFAISSMHFIRGLSELVPDIVCGILNDHQIQALEGQSHGPLYAADQIRWHLKELFRIDNPNDDEDNDNSYDDDDPPQAHYDYATIQQLTTLEEQVNGLILQIGTLERIRSTPLPLVYVSHLRTFLLCFLIATPYVWESTLGYATIPIVGLTAFALLGLEGAAQEVESPFQKHRTNHLNMDSFCLVLLQNMTQQLRTTADRQIQQQQQQQQRRNESRQDYETPAAVIGSNDVESLHSPKTALQEEPLLKDLRDVTIPTIPKEGIGASHQGDVMNRNEMEDGLSDYSA